MFSANHSLFTREPAAPPAEPVTLDDVLDADEIRETDEVTFSDSMMLKSAFYVVIHGRLTGVFDDW